MINQLKWVGDSCLSVYFEEKIAPEINDCAIALKRELIKAHIKGVLSVISTYHTVSVFYRPMETDRSQLAHEVETLLDSLRSNVASIHKTIEIPVVYKGEDLLHVAAYTGLSTSEVVRLHVARLYRVYMIGFTPGFPYLGGMDERLRTPRLKTPRKTVKSGSVGIADFQTGIYSVDSPGGWNIIGHTSAKLFDPCSENPFLLQSGQMIRFVPIDVE